MRSRPEVRGSSAGRVRSAMDSSPTTIDGIDLLAVPGALQWHEAVAVVLQLADTIRQVEVTHVPDLSHIQLSFDGTIAILPGATGTDQPVTQLAETLKLLVQSTAAPGELAQLIDQAKGGSSDQNVDHFATSLHYFERPDRPLVLRAVVERIAKAAADARMAQVVERVRAKALEAKVSPAPTTSEPAKRRSPLNVAIALLLVLAILLGGGAVAWWRFRPLLVHAGSGVRSAATRVGQGIAKAFDGGVARLLGDETRKQASDVKKTAPAPPRRTSSARPRPKQAPLAGSHTLTTARLAPIPELWDGVLPFRVDRIDEVIVITTQPERLVTPPDTERGRIFSRADAGVTPPVPMQPLLGRITTDDTVMPGDMELVIDAKGGVERVTLLSPSRYQDRWLIYAMKARKFAPATADGNRVRYCLRIRTTM